jgi:predicted house-cleaning noncanonical NTP pyrophosphatase (MazG superfamily)
MASGKLVRDRIPEIIQAEGRKPVITRLTVEALLTALYDKLAEEHEELLTAERVADKREEIADMIEVLIGIAAQYGCGEAQLMEVVARKRAERGGFAEGLFYEGDE